MKSLKILNKTTKPRSVLVLRALIVLLFAYASASLAIDRGSWWFYLITFIFAYLAVKDLSKIIRK